MRGRPFHAPHVKMSHRRDLKLCRDSPISLSVHVLRMIVETNADRDSLPGQSANVERINENPKFKRRIMNMKKFLSFLLTFICVLGLGAVANAQIRREIVVPLPLDFVVSDKTL